MVRMVYRVRKLQAVAQKNKEKEYSKLDFVPLR